MKMNEINFRSIITDFNDGQNIIGQTSWKSHDTDQVLRLTA